MDLQNKTVLITGAAKRIGKEIARHFAKKGAHVLIHYRNSRKEAEELAQELKLLKIKTHLYQADLTRQNDIQKMVTQILKENEGVDILVNNASIFYPTPFGKITEKDWDQFFAANLKAPFFLSQALAPSMKKKGRGHIINIADWSGLRPYTGYLPYCTSKGALITLTQGLAKTLAPEIRVNAVCPGPILPPPDFTEDEKEKVAQNTLLGRWGNPEDIAKMVVFLAEQEFITGSYHLVDGGESLK